MFMKSESILIIEVLHPELGVTQGTLHNLFWIFEYIIAGLFAGPLSAYCLEI